MNLSNSLLRRANGQIRPEWKFGAFIILVTTAYALAGPIAGFLVNAFPALKDWNWAFNGIFVLLLLGGTTCCLRLEGRTLASLGLIPTKSRIREFAIGFFIGTLLFVIIILVQSIRAGSAWVLNQNASFQAILGGIGIAALSVLAEELLFRGYGFVRLADAVGPWPAQLAIALMFGFYHVMMWSATGAEAYFMIATTALGSLVFGMAFFRSGGMAMPIGLHLGGNWVQANVLGFAVQQDPPSLWKMALSPEQAAMLFAPELPAKLPHLLAFTLIFVILLQWRREEPLLSRLDFFSLTERKGK